MGLINEERRTYITDDEIDAGGGSTDGGVQRTRPDLTIEERQNGLGWKRKESLRVGSQSIGSSADDKVQVGQLAVLGAGDLEETSGTVELSTGGRDVLVVRVGGEEDEGGSGVDDTGGGAQDGSTVIVHALVDTPVRTSRRSGGERDVGDGSSDLGGVGSTEGELAVGNGLRGGGSVVDTDDLGGDGSLRLEVVGDGGDGVGVGDGAFGEVDGTNTEDTIDTIEARGSGSDTDGLAGDHEA